METKKKKKIKGGYYLKPRRFWKGSLAHQSPCDRELWDWLCGNANYKDTETCKRGQVITSVEEIQNALYWRKGFIKYFYTVRQLVGSLVRHRKGRRLSSLPLESNPDRMVITLSNYAFYQDPKSYEKLLDKTRGSTVGKRQVNGRVRASFLEKNLKKVKNIYSVYQEKINSGSQLTKKSKIKIKERLDEFSETKLLKAIDNFSKDTWWMKHNKHRGVAWFFHSEDRIDQLINLEPKQGQRKALDFTK